MEHIEKLAIEKINEIDSRIEEPKECLCPLCFELVESENELMRYYSNIFKRTVLSCLTCKRFNDESLEDTECK